MIRYLAEKLWAAVAPAVELERLRRIERKLSNRLVVAQAVAKNIVMYERRRCAAVARGLGDSFFTREAKEAARIIAEWIEKEPTHDGEHDGET